ncbi:hypothetical protein DENSPDRAFT_591332 [Dentipellis sp. KUC8613]|nr:hypothetical protein DENSPDRAFT_591332 [Dentipellis sp. KUC8613]
MNSAGALGARVWSWAVARMGGWGLGVPVYHQVLACRKPVGVVLGAFEFCMKERLSITGNGVSSLDLYCGCGCGPLALSLATTTGAVVLPLDSRPSSSRDLLGPFAGVCLPALCVVHGGWRNRGGVSTVCPTNFGFLRQRRRRWRSRLRR